MDTRERILSCAEELFCLKGYDAVGVQEIVDRAGTSKPSLYYYFGSKRGLLETLLDLKFEKLRERISQEDDGQTEIRVRLHRMALACFRYFHEEKQFYLLMMALFYSARENEAYQVVKPYLATLFQTTVDLFESAKQQLGNMNGRQELFAMSFIGVINQYLLMAGTLEEENPEEKERQLHRLVDQYMYGIFS